MKKSGDIVGHVPHNICSPFQWQYYLTVDLTDHKGQEVVDHCDISQS